MVDLMGVEQMSGFTFPTSMKATFRPQAWINNYAVDVDPQGPTTWDVSAEHLQYLIQTLGAKDFDLVFESSYESDLVREDPAAPEWVRNWTGPFWVDVDGTYADA